MKARKDLTRVMLETKYGVIDVDYERGTVTTKLLGVRLKSPDNSGLLVRTATIKCDASASDSTIIRYMNLLVCLYDSETGKLFSLPFHKLVYVWYKGDIIASDKYTLIDHIDSNPLNNNPSNLQLVDESGNQKKRIKYDKFYFDEIKGKTINEVKDMILTRIEFCESLMKF